MSLLVITPLSWHALWSRGRKQHECHIWTDNEGIGFEEKYPDRICEPFRRLPGRSVDEETRMRWAICRKIMTCSVPRQETTFRVILPLHQLEQERRP